MAQNWFIALPVPAGAWFSALPQPPAGLRRFHADDLHLTVAFLGGVSEGAARAGWAALRWPLGPVEVSLGEVVPMGPPGRYSALSALLADGRSEVEAAMGAARGAALAAAGAAPDKYGPKAHVTLARPTRAATDAERAAGLGWAAGLRLSARVVLGAPALYTWSADRAERLFQRVA